MKIYFYKELKSVTIFIGIFLNLKAKNYSIFKNKLFQDYFGANNTTILTLRNGWKATLNNPSPQNNVGKAEMPIGKHYAITIFY